MLPEMIKIAKQNDLKFRVVYIGNAVQLNMNNICLPKLSLLCLTKYSFCINSVNVNSIKDLI